MDEWMNCVGLKQSPQASHKMDEHPSPFGTLDEREIVAIRRVPWEHYRMLSVLPSEVRFHHFFVLW